MKTPFIVLATVLGTVFSIPAIAADEHADHTAMHGEKSGVSAQMTDGLVKKVDKSAGKVTIAHGPLLNLNMPAMTMAFRVKDAAWLDQMQLGAKIRFLADDVNGSLTVIRFEAAK